MTRTKKEGVRNTNLRFEIVREINLAFFIDDDAKIEGLVLREANKVHLFLENE